MPEIQALCQTEARLAILAIPAILAISWSAMIRADPWQGVAFANGMDSSIRDYENGVERLSMSTTNRAGRP